MTVRLVTTSAAGVTLMLSFGMLGGANCNAVASPASHRHGAFVGHWECVSSPTPTGLFLFRTFDFKPDGTFRSIDSLQERPPVQVWAGTWRASPRMVTVKYKASRIGSEAQSIPSEAGFGYRFIDTRKSAFETTLSYSNGPVNYICSPSIGDIANRKLQDVLARDVANH